ncbi:phosphonatase-like hydrolase [Streptomyces hebeiensis]|uniref:Phosphonatase-like hydrolase n=1 Tax=Streptomyces hebeiensis TaxID=229486 RepID=A0ABN1V224_9ACTN
MNHNDSSHVIDLAVLDMAGTTIADNGTVERSVDEALFLAGLDAITPETLRPLRGMAKTDMFNRLAPDPRKAAEAHRHFIDLMLKAVLNGELTAKSGAETVLAGLRERGIKVCLMTGFDVAVQDALLETLGWRGLVDLTVAQSGTLRGRPYPDLILTAVVELGIDAVQRVLVAGDTVNDLLAGTRAGAGRVIGVLGGAHDRARLQAAPHTAIADDLEEVLLHLA